MANFAANSAVVQRIHSLVGVGIDTDVRVNLNPVESPFHSSVH